MLYQKLICGDEGDGAPWLLVEETMLLAGSDPSIDGFRAKRFPFRVGDIPAFLPPVLIADR